MYIFVTVKPVGETPKQGIFQDTEELIVWPGNVPGR